MYSVLQMSSAWRVSHRIQMMLHFIRYGKIIGIIYQGGVEEVWGIYVPIFGYGSISFIFITISQNSVTSFLQMSK